MAPESDRVSVNTTLPTRPLPTNSARPAITTERLLIRPLVPEDVHALHVLRTQPEVMANTAQQVPDKDLDATRENLARFLAPHDGRTYNCAICLRETGEFIGIGGCHILSSGFGWPEIGYMFRREYWGMGMATEFVRAWLGLWGGLLREEGEEVVDPASVVVGGDGHGSAREIVTAITTEENVASQKILAKCGFERFTTWREPDLRDPKVDIELRAFRYVVPLPGAEA